LLEEFDEAQQTAKLREKEITFLFCAQPPSRSSPHSLCDVWWLPEWDIVSERTIRPKL